MTAYHHHMNHHHSMSPARSTLVQARALWACDSTLTSSSALSSQRKRDKKWEVDSMAEVSGT